jgi:flagellar basal-body rod protein FlgC
MFSAAAISLSGMSAQVDRLDMVASNLANQGSLGALPGPNGAIPAGQTGAYQAGTVGTTALPGGGVAATARPYQPAVLAQYDPTAPYANAQGMIGVPNVSVDQEVTTMADASNAYRANLSAFKASDNLTRQALNLTA